MKKYTWNLLLIFVFLTGFAQAQEPSDTTKQAKVVVTTQDGNQRIGIILNDDGREILLLTEHIGKIYIRKENIVSIKPFEEKQVQKFNGEYITPGPFTTRYFFTTNSLPIKKGDDKAFQFALAGVTRISDGRVQAFPMPMCSWFFKF